MKEYLEFGIDLDNEGNAGKSIIEVSSYFLPGHEYMMSFMDINNTDKLEDILIRIKNSYKNTSINTEEIISDIKELHPYFTICSNAEACFNRTLALTLFEDVHFKDDSKEELQPVFEKSMCHGGGLEPDIQYWLSNGEIESFDDVIKCYDDLRMRAALIFDDSKEKLAKLPDAARCALYNTVSGCDDSLLEIPVRYEYCSSLSTRVSEKITFDDNADNLYDDIFAISPEENDVSDSIYNILKSLPAEGDDNRLCYVIRSFTALIQLETHLMLRDNIRLNRCKNCGRLYVVSEAGQETCKYKDADGSSCYSREKRLLFERQISKYYRRAYKTMFDRVAHGKETSSHFDIWKTKMTDRKKRILDGEFQYTLEDGNPFKI